jgi:hypothetical protein
VSPDAPNKVRARRRAWLTRVLVAGLAVAAVLVGFAISRTGTAAPDQSGSTEPDIYVRVARGDLASRLVTRGTVVTAQRTEILAPEPDDGYDPVVTRLPKVGRKLKLGTAPVEFAGRPIILLGGDVPPFRDLALGDQGADVARLQQSLHELGLMGPKPTAVFDAGTQRALRTLYERLGYVAPGGAQAPFFSRREFRVVPDGRLNVAAVPVKLGDLAEPAQPLVVAGSGDPVLHVDLGVSSLDEFIGWTAQVDVAGTPIPGVVSHAEQPDPALSEGDSEPRPHLVVEAKGLDEAGLGSNLKVVLTDEILEDALLVPMSALQVDVSGGHVVQVKRGEALTAGIPVRLVGEADGVAAVEPERPDDVHEGDLVRVFAP